MTCAGLSVSFDFSLYKVDVKYEQSPSVNREVIGSGKLIPERQCSAICINNIFNFIVLSEHIRIIEICLCPLYSVLLQYALQ